MSLGSALLDAALGSASARATVIPWMITTDQGDVEVGSAGAEVPGGYGAEKLAPLGRGQEQYAVKVKIQDPCSRAPLPPSLPPSFPRSLAPSLPPVGE